MKVIVAGASGNIGRLTATHLFERIDPTDVILVTRRPEAVAEFGERGATVRFGDFDDPTGLPAAFAGGDRLLVISTNGQGRRVAQHRAAIDAAKAAGVQHIAYTSLLNPVRDNPVADDHRHTERALRESGLSWTFLRYSLFSEALLGRAAQAIALGKLVTTGGKGLLARVSRSDCAEVAAVVLTGDGHAGKAYDITGPALHSQADYAAMFTELSGRPVEVVDIDDATLIRNLMAAGAGSEQAQFAADYGSGTRNGFFNVLTTTVEDLTGAPADDFYGVLLAHRSELVGG